MSDSYFNEESDYSEEHTSDNDEFRCTLLQPFQKKRVIMRGPYHIETSPLICSANQWTGFYMIRTSVIKIFNSIVKCLSLILWVSHQK